MKRLLLVGCHAWARSARHAFLLTTAWTALAGPWIAAPREVHATIPNEFRLVDVAEQAGIHFQHRYGRRAKGYPTEFGGSGAAWLDFDFDGWPDVFLVNAVEEPADRPWAASRGSEDGDEDLGHALFRNRLGWFSRVDAGVGDIVWGNGAAVGDVDNDGFVDLYVTAIGPNTLYRNNGDGTFARWSAGVEDPAWGTSAAFVDWDRDGSLDLYVVNYVEFDAESTPTLGDGVCFYRGIEVFCGPEGLVGAADAFYRNRGDGRFEPWSGIEVDAERTYGFATIATDCDDNRWPDIYVATDSTINLLYRRSEAGADAVDDWSLFGGAGYSGAGREQAGMGVTAADFDRDSDLDLFVTNFQHDHNTLYRNRGDCVFEDASEQLGLSLSSLPFMGWAPLFLDLDADADEDLFVANGHIYPQLDTAGLEPYAQRNLLYRNELAETGEAVFSEIGQAAGPGLAIEDSSRGAAAGDFDNDGDWDLLVTNIDSRPNLLRNDGEHGLAALRLSLVGRTGNRSAYGSRIVVTSGDVTQTFELRGSDGYAGSNDARLLAFLPSGRADRVVISWPSGATTELNELGPVWLIVAEGRGAIAQAAVSGVGTQAAPRATGPRAKRRHGRNPDGR